VRAPEHARFRPFTPLPMKTSADFERWQPWMSSAVFEALS
jgi:hypothetical protein